jgi:hypothetical protein
MDTLEKTIGALGEEFLDKLFSMDLEVTFKIDGSALQVKCNEDGEVTFHKRSGVLTKVGPEITKKDLVTLGGLYDDQIEYLKKYKKDLCKYKLLSFEILDGSSHVIKMTAKNNLVLLGAIDYEDNPVPVSKTNELAEKIDVSFVPVIFTGKLSDEQKKSLLEWCSLSSDKKEEKTGTTSFCKYVLELLTGDKEFDTHFMKSNDEMIEGFVFKFNDDDKTYLAKLIDPLFTKQFSGTNLGSKDMDSTPSNVIKIFKDAFSKMGTVPDGNDDVEKLCNNFLFIMNNSKYYNELLTAGTELKIKPVNEKYLTEKLKKFISKSDVLKKIFAIYFICFQKEKRQARIIPTELQKEINPIIKKILE